MLTKRYRIVSLLGKGGMGEVYRVDDLEVGQSVALKFLPAPVVGDAGGARLRRFRSEVRVARQVSHSNVCRVYYLGEVEGRHFITMEYIDGGDLAAALRRKKRQSQMPSGMPETEVFGPDRVFRIHRGFLFLHVAFRTVEDQHASAMFHKSHDYPSRRL